MDNQSPPQPVSQETQPQQQEIQPQQRPQGHQRGEDKRQAIKAAAIASLRATRGVPEPVQAQPAAPAAVETSAAAPVAPQSAEIDARIAAKAAELQAKEQSALSRLQAAEAKEAELRAALDNPLEFISKVGMTEEEWKNFLTGGGKLTPEQQKLKQMERELAEMKAATAKERENAALQSHYSQISSVMGEFPLAAREFTPADVRSHALAISKAEGNRHVTWTEAAKSLEDTLTTKYQSYLQDEKISAKLGYSVSKPKSELAAPQPTTLGRNTAPTSVADNKINPRDFAAKKAAYLEMLRRQQG